MYRLTGYHVHIWHLEQNRSYLERNASSLDVANLYIEPRFRVGNIVSVFRLKTRRFLLQIRSVGHSYQNTHKTQCLPVDKALAGIKTL
jgi:hypothetical protein